MRITLLKSCERLFSEQQIVQVLHDFIKHVHNLLLSVVFENNHVAALLYMHAQRHG